MGLFAKLFKKKEGETRLDNTAFWAWFATNEKQFFTAIQQRKNIEKNFLDPVIEKLHQVNKQFYCLCGMKDERTAELIITPEGDLRAIVFTEELIKAAPPLPNWKFTALKPAMKMTDLSIAMADFKFEKSNIWFVSNSRPDFPDEIDITLVHPDYTEENKAAVSNGLLIFLDNGLGELNAITHIDNITFANVTGVTEELIPIEKLEAYLNWRQAEFVEKYQLASYDTENDEYAIMEGEDAKGNQILATVNQVLLGWDAKASHPWLMAVEIPYDGAENNGMPNDETYQLMNQFEDELNQKLPNAGGYLNVGRELYNGKRTIWYAAKEFRQLSAVTAATIENYQSTLKVSYDIFKDKYWMALSKYEKAAEG